MKNVDKKLKKKTFQLQNGCVNDLEGRFSDQLTEERTKFTSDFETFESETTNHLNDFDTIMCAMEQTNINMTGDIRQEFQSLRDELKNRTQEWKNF